MALPKKRGLRAHWQHACRLLLQQASAAPLTRQVQVALFMDGVILERVIHARVGEVVVHERAAKALLKASDAEDFLA